MQFNANIKNAIAGSYSIRYPNGEFRTIAIRHADDSFFKWEKGSLLLGFLVGPDNSNDYRYVARINVEKGTVQFFSKFVQQTSKDKLPLIVRALEIAANTWKLTESERTPGKAYALKSENCIRCSRKLTNADTLEECFGYGPICFEKVFGIAA